MKKLILALVLFVVFAAQGYCADMPVMADNPAAAPVQATDAGNKICPVSGDKVSGVDFVEYQGKRYGLCCPMCKAAFLANPEVHLAKLNAPQAQATAETVPATPAAPTEEPVSAVSTN